MLDSVVNLVIDDATADIYDDLLLQLHEARDQQNELEEENARLRGEFVSINEDAAKLKRKLQHDFLLVMAQLSEKDRQEEVIHSLREQLDTMHRKDNHQKDGSESNDSLSAPVAGQSTRARGPEESVNRSFKNEPGASQQELGRDASASSSSAAAEPVAPATALPPSYDSLNLRPGSQTPGTPILGVSAEAANGRRRVTKVGSNQSIAQRAANAVSRMTNGEIREVAALGSRLRKLQKAYDKLQGEKDDLVKEVRAKEKVRDFLVKEAKSAKEEAARAVAQSSADQEVIAYLDGAHREVEQKVDEVTTERDAALKQAKLAEEKYLELRERAEREQKKLTEDARSTGRSVGQLKAEKKLLVKEVKRLQEQLAKTKQALQVYLK